MHNVPDPMCKIRAAIAAQVQTLAAAARETTQAVAALETTQAAQAASPVATATWSNLSIGRR